MATKKAAALRQPQIAYRPRQKGRGVRIRLNSTGFNPPGFFDKPRGFGPKP